MTRTIALLASIAALSACNAADVRDRGIQFTSGNDVGGGSYLNAFAAVITVDAASRNAIERWEVEVGSSYILSEGDAPTGEVSVSVGLFDEVASGRISDGTATALWDNVPLRACSDIGFTETAGGGCEVGALVFVGSNVSNAFTASVSVKGWLPDDSEVDADDFVVSATLTEGE